MVTQYGMSEKLGPATFEQPGSLFLKSPFFLRERQPFSEKTAQEIDSEVKKILDVALRMATTAVEVNHEFIERGAERLLEVETLEEKEIYELWTSVGKPSEERLRAVGDG